jgi:O-antigen/teichoic acid export membrane protein
MALGLAPAVTTSGSDTSVAALLLALVIGESITVLVAWWQLGESREAGEKGHDRAITLRAVTPFAGTSLMQVAYNRFDIVLIAAIASGATVGLYGPATRLQDLMFVLPGIASAVLLPYASRLFAISPQDSSQTRAMWLRLAAGAIGGSIATALVVTIAAPTVIHAVLGIEYAGSVLPVQIIVWSVPLIAFNSTLAAVISGRRKAHFVTYAMAAALTTVVVVDIALVPSLGAVGAAIAATIREVPAAAVVLFGARESGLFARERVAQAVVSVVRGERP